MMTLVSLKCIDGIMKAFNECKWQMVLSVRADDILWALTECNGIVSLWS